MSIATTCPQVVRASVPDHHSHATQHLIDHDGGCRSAGTTSFVAAVCPCGCDERSAALGARSGPGVALLPATAPLVPPAGVALVLAESSYAPLAPARAIDHVPLFA